MSLLTLNKENINMSHKSDIAMKERGKLQFDCIICREISGLAE